MKYLGKNSRFGAICCGIMTHQASWAGGTLYRKGSDRTCVIDLTAKNFFVEEGRRLEVVVGVTRLIHF